MTSTLNHETQTVAPADTTLYLAGPYSPCIRGFCRKGRLSPALHTCGELSKYHEFLHSCPTANPYLSAVLTQILRGNSLNQNSIYGSSNPRINYTGMNQLSTSEKLRKDAAHRRCYPSSMDMRSLTNRGALSVWKTFQ